MFRPQPALTKSLQLLEEDLGAKLFYRSARGMEPTEAGNVLYRHARAIDQEARFASLDIQENHLNLAGRIRIGIGPVLALSAFPDVFVDFHRQFPSVEVTVDMGVSSRLMEGLARDDFDLVVTAFPGDPLPEKYVALPVFRSDMIVICRTDHPLRKSGGATLEELCKYQRVGFSEDREFEKRSHRSLGASAAKMRPLLQTTSLSVMFGILSATDYYAIVSSMILPSAQRDGLDRLTIHHDLWQLDIGLVCKSTLSTTRPVVAIRDALLKYVHHRSHPAGSSQC
ncbi:LysR family transcriptional regulator [Microvirga arabica]|uniref:LysR family transcriptional regulator n=1 Tax=Microvirga arabica TaxID=1128671 RepID=A0ABV6YAE3_9HYPH